MADVDGSGEPLPRVVAILVVHDGIAWLPSVLGTLAQQRYPALDLVVVDNASRDGSAELLARRIPSDRLLTLARNRGFTRAVGEALRHEALTGADYVLLLHDDLVLAPTAVARLVQALRDDPSLAIVGPKLREWSEEPRLQAVGSTVDRFGRVENPLEPFELDQGQHDTERDVLFVSTGGLLVRREALADIGGLDPRYPAFRDDLDLCWRAWLRGWRVGVAPQAVAYHLAAGTRGVRPVVGGRSWEPRYLAERHTLATLLKNYGGLRLALVLPVVLALAVGKVIAFLATRRVTAAGAVLRAWIWNIGQLPRTLRRRRAVQRRRSVTDGELDKLFMPGLPRARAYIEAIAEWLAGGGTEALLDTDAPAPGTQETSTGRLARTIRRYPVLVAGAALAVAYLLSLVPLLGGGQVVGGQIAPWPNSPLEFLRAYASPWNGEPVASEAFASPIQALLGAVSFLGFGSAWLAQRLIVFGLLPFAWLLAVRAGRVITSWPGPRLLGATIYVLSPPVLGALAEGRLGVLIAAALLPGLVLLTVRVADPRTQPVRAWRAVALLAVALAAVIAAAPGLALPVIAAALVVGLLVVTRGRVREGWRPPVRLAVALGGAIVVLAPWAIGLVLAGEAPRPFEPGIALPAWRAALLVPPVLPGADGLPMVIAAATTVAIILGALLVGLRQRPGAVVGLTLVASAFAVAAWGAARLEFEWVWSPALLLPAALAVGGLAVVAARCVAGGLEAYAFGTRQVALVVASVVLLLGLAVMVGRVTIGPWSALEREPQLTPAFVTADLPRVGPYRVLLLDVEGGEVRWDVVGGAGPTMVSFGTAQDRNLLDNIGDVVGGAIGGADPTASAKLGVFNIRYVVADVDEDLRDALGDQLALEPVPTGAGLVYRVETWLPRVVALDEGRAEALLATGDPGSTRAIEEEGLRDTRRDVITDEVDGGALLVVSEATSPRWRASAEGMGLEAVAVEGVNAFALPDDVERVTVRVAGGLVHRGLVGVQLAVVLLVLSLALRPPGFAEQRRRAPGRRLPDELGSEPAAPSDTAPTSTSGQAP